MTSNEIGNLSDREALAEMRAYENHIRTESASLNLTVEHADRMKAKNDAFEASLDAWDAVQLEEDAKSQAKKTGRKEAVGEYRVQRNMSYADTSITDRALAAAGFPPRDKVKTASAAPTTAPVGWIDFGRRKHVIYFRDSATPDSEAKPKGVRGCEIHRYIGDAPPASEDDFKWVVTDSDSPYVAFYDMELAGKKVWYMLRWVSNGGETGEWSETIEATVNG